MFDRLEVLIGEENLKKIMSKKILVIGVGGVGGYVAESLVRSGINHLTMVDKDVIDVTNLNRQIIALHSTLGKYKVDVLKNRLEDINPSAHISTYRVNLTEENIESLELDTYDYIIDCIDEVKVKTVLAKISLRKGLKLIMSTGTARKFDPSKLEMTTLDKTSYDPLAKKLRLYLRDYDTKKIVVLASTEHPQKTGDNVLGSTAFVPSSGGILIGSYIIRDILGK